jgi:probable phosphoglycerate mutase
MLLVRHGETALSVERRFSGTSDPGLTERGRAQAQAVAERLTGWDVAAVVSSPRVRTQQTAAAIAGVLGIDPVIDAGVAETDFGEWEGHTFAEIRERWPEDIKAWLADPDVAPPGGESFSATFARVETARARLVAEHSGATVVVVSHVTPIKAMVREALGAPAHVLFRVHLDPASLSTIDSYAGGIGVVRLLNDTSHLKADLKTPPAS